MIYILIYRYGWYYRKIQEFDKEISQIIKTNIENGNIVVIADDLEDICKKIGIKLENLEKIHE